MKNKQKINKQLSKELLIRYSFGSIISIVLFVLFLTLGSKVKSMTGGIYFDKVIISHIHDLVTPRVRGIMIFISFLGSAKFYVPVGIGVVVYFIKKQYYINAIVLVNALLGSAIINYLVKLYYTRVRPEEYFQITETGFSFPSGHSMVAISSYFVLTYLLFRKQKWEFKKNVAWLSTLVLVLCIGFSRIYLGVHWPTDVIGGFSLGFIWVNVNIIIVEMLDRKYEKTI